MAPSTNDDGDAAAPASAASLGRVPQACVACRRKKIKCDGNNPCFNCSTREQFCEYPVSRDNASVSRRYAASFEDRCQQMDDLCQRLETLTERLTHSLASLAQTTGTCGHSDGGAAELLQAAQVLRSMPTPVSASRQVTDVWPDPVAAEKPTSHVAVGSSRVDDLNEDQVEEVDGGAIESSIDGDGEDTDCDESPEPGGPRRDKIGRVGMLVRDSYGRLRFMGGATNHMLIEAVKSLSPGGSGSQSSTPDTSGSAPPVQASAAGFEIPLFIQGSVWPELPFLPKPEQLSRPPKYVADLLVKLYFDQLHYTFPVIYKPHFMQKYGQMLRPSSDASLATERRFLMVFYAVCACASSLLPGSADRKFAGIEHYEKALLLCFAANGEASLERVQCLALLAMCAAGWNTLTQSWTLAGQAVRAAQDLGLHLSRRLIMPTPTASEVGGPIDFLQQQIARRVWWSIYSLDRVISICLGRPMAASDEDCDCQLPLDMSDERLESYPRELQQDGSSGTTGFIALFRLCRIAGKIQQLHSPLHLRELASKNDDKRRGFLAKVAALDRSLTSWVESLPDEIRFSANALGNTPKGSVELTMCVIIFMVHAGSLLNLYRCLAGNPRLSPDGDAKRVHAISQCISAAKSCINAAELVRDLVPPSHHLAFCVYYLTLSGVVLLRMPTPHGDAELAANAEKCVQLLTDLEPLWSGASRGRAIVAKLLAEYRTKGVNAETTVATSADTNAAPQALGNGAKRSFREYSEGERNDDALLWHQIPGSELLNFDLSDLYTM